MKYRAPTLILKDADGRDIANAFISKSGQTHLYISNPKTGVLAKEKVLKFCSMQKALSTLKGLDWISAKETGLRK